MKFNVLGVGSLVYVTNSARTKVYEAASVFNYYASTSVATAWAGVLLGVGILPLLPVLVCCYCLPVNLSRLIGNA
jgi:hypothetical protein